MFIYIVKIQNEEIYKIGKANNVMKRLRQLPYVFDLEASFFYDVGDLALRYESSIHTLLKSASVDYLVKQDGYTEMYDSRVLTFIDSWANFIGLDRHTFDELADGTDDKGVLSMQLYTLLEDVRKLRLRKKVTQEELSELTGLSRSTIARIEQGKGASVSLGNIIMIVEALEELPDNDYLCEYDGVGGYGSSERVRLPKEHW